MLGKVRIMMGVVVVAGILLWMVGGQIAAGSTTPGTVNDPLVTKSYVDLKVAELKSDLIALLENSVVTSDPESGQGSIPDENAEEVIPTPEGGITMADVKAYVNDQLMSNDAVTDGENRPESLDGASLFVVVKANNGQSLICGASAEVILRAGSATVIAGADGDGLANLTTGEDLRAGDVVPLQNHLLVSRDDGRGLLVTSDDTKGDTYILVKGDYRLE